MQEILERKPAEECYAIADVEQALLKIYFQRCFFTPVFRKGVVKMVEVIKYGNKRRVTCGTCESFLEYGKEDVKTVQTGANEWEGEIICPNCREKVRVKEQGGLNVSHLWVK